MDTDQKRRGLTNHRFNKSHCGPGIILDRAFDTRLVNDFAERY